MSARLTHHRGGKWLWSWTLDAEDWNGCFDTLEDAITDAMEWRDMDIVDDDAPAYFAHGRKISKAECEERGLDWPWYQVDRDAALKIFMTSNTE
jgi:hypothetical protein